MPGAEGAALSHHTSLQAGSGAELKGCESWPSSRAAHRGREPVWLGNSSGLRFSRKSVFEGDLLPLRSTLLNASSDSRGRSWFPLALPVVGHGAPDPYQKLGATAARSTRALGKPRPPLAAPPPPSVCRGSIRLPSSAPGYRAETNRCDTPQHAWGLW